MEHKNGYDFRFNKIDDDLADIRDHLAKTLQQTNESIDRLSKSIDKLNLSFDAFLLFAQNNIPVKVVFWMFLILVLTIAGVEGIKHLSMSKFLSIAP